MKKVDVLVLGGGAGGLSVAAGAAYMGLSVTLIAPQPMGGDCLHFGCIPSKSLLHAAKNGWPWLETHAHIQSTISSIQPHDSQARFEQLGIHVVAGEGRLTGVREVTTISGEVFRGRYVVLATGSSPRTHRACHGLKIPQKLNNQSFWNAIKERQLSGRVAILGGGAMALEMAEALVGMGHEVIMICRGDLLGFSSASLKHYLSNYILGLGVQLLKNTEVTHVEQTDEVLTIKLSNGQTCEVEHILEAMGREVSWEGLGLQNILRKPPLVDPFLRVGKLPWLFAVGDVSGAPMSTHAAAYEASVVLKNILGIMPWLRRRGSMPQAIYLKDEILLVGSMPHELEESSRPYMVLQPERPSDRALTECRKSFAELYICPRTDRILGAALMFPAASLLAPWLDDLINKKRSVAELMKPIIPYPSDAELLSMMARQRQARKLTPWVKTFLRVLVRQPVKFG